MIKLDDFVFLNEWLGRPIWRVTKSPHANEYGMQKIEFRSFIARKVDPTGHLFIFIDDIKIGQNDMLFESEYEAQKYIYLNIRKIPNVISYDTQVSVFSDAIYYRWSTI